MKTENYEVIFAIVNAGFAEDVMDVARENGARGRHHTKRPRGGQRGHRPLFRHHRPCGQGDSDDGGGKNIRDRVLNAIYKEMGMAKKAKGIAFSLPVSDVAGLAVPEPEKRNDFYKKAPERVLFCGQNYKQRKQR